MNEVIDYNGIKVICRPNCTDRNIATCIIGNGPTMASDEYHIRRLAKAGGVFVDIGAYGGHASLLATQLGMTCVAIEPLADNLENLRANVALNGMGDKIEVVPAAIGGGSIFWNDQSSDFAVMHRFVAQTKASADAVEVKVDVVDLDVLLDRHPSVHIIKTDCEGGEWAIAQATKTLAKTNYIVGEFHGRDERTFDDFLEKFVGFRDVSAEFGDGPSKDGILRLFVFVRSNYDGN